MARRECEFGAAVTNLRARDSFYQCNGFRQEHAVTRDGDRRASRIFRLAHVILGIPGRHADYSRMSAEHLGEVVDCLGVQAANGAVATEHSEHFDIGNRFARKVSELCGLIVVLFDYKAAHARASGATCHVENVERAGCLTAMWPETVRVEVSVNVYDVAHQRARGPARSRKA